MVDLVSQSTLGIHWCSVELEDQLSGMKIQYVNQHFCRFLMVDISVDNLAYKPTNSSLGPPKWLWLKILDIRKVWFLTRHDQICGSIPMHSCSIYSMSIFKWINGIPHTIHEASAQVAMPVAGLSWCRPSHKAARISMSTRKTFKYFAPKLLKNSWLIGAHLLKIFDGLLMFIPLKI